MTSGHERIETAKLPLVQYWHSARIPTDVAEMLASFGKCNPDLEHMVFDEVKADSFIAEHMTGRELAAFRACALPAMQADYFRYCAGLAIGGICCDVDYYCAQPLKSLIERTDRGVVFQTPNDAVHNGFFLFKSPDHPLLRLILDIATTSIEGRFWEEVWWTTGPGILTVLWALHEHGTFDAARESARQRGVESKVMRILPVVGDYSRVRTAFDGVTVEPFDLARAWLQKPDTPPSYKQTDLHWNNWQASGMTIFR